MAHPHSTSHSASHSTHHHDLAELLDLDAEVLHEYHHEVMSWAASLVPGQGRIVDLGAGTGTASLALARLRPDASVVAVDISSPMLEEIRRKAQALGVADRVRTVVADLDQTWPSDLGGADLVWAAASLHHVADPGRVLGLVFSALRPGGALMATEPGSFPRFLADPAGMALEERGHAAMAEARAEAGMHMDEDWAARFVEAGFTIEAERHFDVVLRPPLPAGAVRYAHVSLHRMRDGLADRLGADDLAALEAAAAGVAGRDDLTVRTSRTVWLARRPDC
jgi:SAM-dependent methyltransferase